MEIDSTQVNRNSETEFIDKFSMYVDSGAGIVHVRTNEMLRACLSIRRHAIHDGAMVKEWDIVNGFRTIDSKKLDDMLSEGDSNIDIASAFGAPLNLIREEERGSNREGMYYFVYIAPHVFMENNPYLAQMLTVYSHVLPSRNVVVVLVTPDVPLPIENNQVLSLHFNPPGIGELKEYLTGLVKDTEPNFSDGVDMSNEEYDKVCYVGSGMTKNHFEMYASLSIVEAGRDGKTSLGIEELTEGISIGKTDVVNSSDILELYPSTEMSNVGGLENLKGWVSRRKACYSDDAREFGVEAPKGIVLVGPPGTGKSLVAKAVSAELGIPLVRLDFGRVFNSLVGASEGRMRQALRMVEAMAPVVLFCDEIDKGLGGIGGGGDSGVSNRVLGSFLTWLQDCKHPVFVIVTANNVTGLPPEMLRRGRFDAIFSTSMPNRSERKEVLRIHLAKRGRSIKEFDKESIEEIVDLSNEYVPAEIESAVKDGLVDAFSAGEEFTLSHVASALKAMVPLSQAFATQIKAMNDWAKNNATPAGLPESTLQSNSNSRRVSARRRG